MHSAQPALANVDDSHLESSCSACSESRAWVQRSHVDLSEVDLIAGCLLLTQVALLGLLLSKLLHVGGSSTPLHGADVRSVLISRLVFESLQFHALGVRHPSKSDISEYT